MLLGLGVSAISDTGSAYAQNEKKLKEYYDDIAAGRLAVKKGYFLSEEDRAFRRYILDISCKGETLFREEHLPLLRAYTFPRLQALADDGLVTWDSRGLSLTAQGHYFIRVVCSTFDLHLQRVAHAKAMPAFSKAI
jgi:oxygen-independent coproporphyrinogen-3 oxidase